MVSYSLERPIEFVRRFWPEDGDMPKHERLRRAFTQSIMDGFWAVGARLPTEAQLVLATPCSLGTVQRALRELAADGIIERRRGSGSVVADLNGPIEEPWHMRFFDGEPDGDGFLPVFTQILERKILTASGPWSEAIGQAAEPVVRIDRIFTINLEIRAYAKFYAVAARFPELAELPESALNGRNFKTFIARRYHVPVHKVRQRVRYETPPDHVAEHCDCPAGLPAMVLNVVAYALNGAPMYYQDFYVPQTPYQLDLGTATRS